MSSNPDTTHPTDRTYIDGIHNRDHRVFTALYNTYHTALIATAQRLPGVSADQADDLVHEVLFAIFRLGTRWNPSQSVAAHLHGAVRKQWLKLREHHRNQHNLVTHRQRDSAHAMSKESPDRHIFQKEAFEVIERAIDALPERYRDAYNAMERGWQDLPPAEVATALGISQQTLRKYVARASQQIREALENAGYATK